MPILSAFGLSNIGGNHENQDIFFIGDGLYGVVDGHGRGGKQIAADAAAVLAAGGDFAAADAAVCSSGLHGGATASVLSVSEAGITVSHVGDSDVRYYDVGLDINGVSLTADHSATSLDEFLRIQKCPTPAEFIYPHQFMTRPIFVKDANDTWILNPLGAFMRSTVRGDFSSYLESTGPFGRNRLAMSRALGDTHMKPYGVIAEPTVTTVDTLCPPAGIRAIVMASDGMWDTIQYAEVGEIVTRPDLVGNAEAAANALMELSMALTIKHFKSLGDNITIVVIYITDTSASAVTKSTEDSPQVLSPSPSPSLQG